MSEHRDETQTLLLAFAAHEILGPLARIRRAAAALDGEASARDAEAIALIRQEAERARRRAEDVIAWAAMAAGPVGPSGSLADLLREAAAGPDPGEAHVVVSVDAEDIPVPVALVRPLLGNLIDNAVRHRRPGTVATIRLTYALEEGAPTLTVADDGPGMAEESVAELLAPFARGHRGRFGLGLAIVAEAALRLGWTMSVTTRVEKGTVFRFGTGPHESKDG